MIDPVSALITLGIVGGGKLVHWFGERKGDAKGYMRGVEAQQKAITSGELRERRLFIPPPHPVPTVLMLSDGRPVLPQGYSVTKDPVRDGSGKFAKTGGQ